MAVYYVNLKARIVCPEKSGRPDLSITKDDILYSLLGDAEEPLDKLSGYAVCSPDSRKLTADMVITSVEFTSPD